LLWAVTVALVTVAIAAIIAATMGAIQEYLSFLGGGAWLEARAEAGVWWITNVK